MANTTPPAERERRRRSMEQVGEIRGTAPPPPAERVGDASDLEQAKHLLLWARAQRITVGQITIGRVSIDVRDLGLRAADPKRDRGPSTSSGDMYAEYGGPLYEDFRRDQAAAYEDDEDDEEPAIEAPTTRRRRRGE